MDRAELKIMEQVLTTEWVTTAVLKQRLQSGAIVGVPKPMLNRVPQLCVSLVNSGIALRRPARAGFTEWRLAKEPDPCAPSKAIQAPDWLPGLLS